jgi:hypothetical protein
MHINNNGFQIAENYVDDITPTKLEKPGEHIQDVQNKLCGTIKLCSGI